MRGASEDRTEPYELYGEGGPERATTQIRSFCVFSTDAMTPARQSCV